MQTYRSPAITRLAVPVASVGLSVAPYLSHAGLVGHVCASFRRCCYLQTLDGEVLCIAEEILGRGPLTVSISLDEGMDLQVLGVSEGTSVSVEGGCIHISSLALDLEGALVWRPQPPAIAPGNLAPEAARRLAVAMSPQTPPDGLGCLLPHVENLGAGQAVEAGCVSALGTLSTTAVTCMVNGLLSGDAPSTEAGVRGLLGLGPGLTPSGDDLLVGLLLALHAGRPSTAGTLARIVAQHGPSMTGMISVAILKQAPLGYGSEAIHQVIEALVSGVPEDEMLHKAGVLRGAGHTSGWDTLVGILLGMHLWEHIAP